MGKLTTVFCSLVFSTAAVGQLQISIGVRETGFAGGAFNGIGGDGGSGGGIEWIDLDAQPLFVDGTWQQFSFSLPSAAVTAFAGSSANGTLEGSYGTLEHVRVRNSGK